MSGGERAERRQWRIKRGERVAERNGLNYAGVFDLTKQLSAPYMLLTIPVSVVAALLLGNPLFGKAFNFISNPIKFLKKKQ